ncbi:hypothetical protein CCM_02187 [Cordyceps militaris CM01]|uniref:Uncharacterized protein n=1 Tax=Cordyceps militaris (strain CM01) TaxID=983644 RepID=G3J8C7_CORMM|nr:uncharacterized protein CCM_02187 [Cordyceps militaris CM01]EGX93916.1 hypothetical protein CCM_02187 [Cordyceps militaris CM01]
MAILKAEYGICDALSMKVEATLLDICATKLLTGQNPGPLFISITIVLSMLKLGTGAETPATPLAQPTIYASCISLPHSSMSSTVKPSPAAFLLRDNNSCI